MSDRKEVITQTSSEIKKEVKSRRGRKIKYQTDEERIEARRRQQKAYRERKKNELLKLKEMFEKKKEQALTDSLEERLQRSLEGGALLPGTKSQQSPEELDE